jgi:putative SOS response-associated peptidase YedK
MCFFTANSKKALAMANRYGRKTNIIEMAQEIINEQYRVNAFSNPLCPIITANQSIETARWGLIPHWTKTVESAKKMRQNCINARSETVFNLPSFRAPILTKRCLVPVTGFFEFHHRGKTVIPYYIFLKNEEIFSFGGVFELWKNHETGEVSQTYSVLTVTANELCGKIHNGGKNPFRMPLIISKEKEEQWLDKSLKNTDIERFFILFDAHKMDAYPISKDFIKKRPDDASIIEPETQIQTKNSLKEKNLFEVS